MERTFKPLQRQLLISIGPLVLISCVGMMMGFPAIVLPKLQKNNETTDDEASWIASISILPSSFTCLIGGFCMEKLGRRMTQLVVCLPFMFGWFLCYFSQSVEVLLIGRFVTGLVAGLLGPITNVYISETSEPSYRGFLLCGLSLAMAVGTLLEHLLGTFLTWQTTALVCALTPLVGGSFIFFTPESPAWLLKKGRLVQAEKTFYWCRGDSNEAKQELVSMMNNRQTKTETDVHFNQIFVGAFLKPLLITGIFFVTMQWSGTEAISAYAISFIESTAGSSLDSYTAMLIIDAIHVVISIVACLLCRLYKKKPLILISGFGATAMMFLLSAFTSLSATYAELDDYRSLTLVCLIGHNIFVNIGLQPLCWTVSGELFPLSMRSYGNAITSASSYLLLFSVVKTVPVMFNTLDVSGTFLTYGLVTLVGTTILGLILPETKDKTLQEIENYFTKSKCNENSPQTNK